MATFRFCCHGASGQRGARARQRRLVCQPTGSSTTSLDLGVYLAAVQSTLIPVHPNGMQRHSILHGFSMSSR